MKGDIIVAGGRTGRKVHLATGPGTSCLNCGHWLRVLAVHYKIADDTQETREKLKKRGAEFCEKCFGTEPVKGGS